MQRWITRVVGVAVVVFAVWMVARNVHAPQPIGRLELGTDAGEDDGGGILTAYGDAAAAPAAASADDGGAPLFLTDLLLPGSPGDAAVGSTLADGTPVPPLPRAAPRQVRFGVVLVSYAGTQPSAGGPRRAARSRAEARTLADKLLETARQDFHAAVREGDPGSADDLGQVKTGILEPAPEFVLFTLPVGGVGGPVDTPRGYWIVKRLE
jgi:hypothetical protein